MLVCNKWWKGFRGSNFGECEKNLKLVCKKQHGKKLMEGEVGVRNNIESWKFPKTRFANKVMMFEKMLEFKQVLLLWEAKFINYAVISLEGPNVDLS